MSSETFPLPLEVVMIIFQHCDIQTLGRLACTCKTFRRIVNTDYLWKEQCKTVLVSNCIDDKIRRRSRPFLPAKEKCIVSQRWIKNQCNIKLLFKYRRLMALNVELERNALFCSNGRRLERYARDQNGSVTSQLEAAKKAHTADISQFVINGNEVISAARDGTIKSWNKQTFKNISEGEIRDNVEEAKDINCVDAKKNVIVSGSRNGSIRLWRLEERSIELAYGIATGVKVLSVAIMPSIRTFVAGLPGTCDIHPLHLYDTERCNKICTLGEHVHGAGIIDLYPENEHTLLSCGYDTYIRLWDIRSPQQCVSSWMEPFDNSIYCVRSDHNMAILSGANRNSMMHLWDKRSINPVNIHCIRKYDSPVYSLAFDSCRKVVALDTAIFQLTYV